MSNNKDTSSIMDAGASFAGRYKIKVEDENGNVVHDFDWENNLVTDYGLKSIMFIGLPTNCFVSDSTDPITTHSSTIDSGQLIYFSMHSASNDRQNAWNSLDPADPIIPYNYGCYLDDEHPERSFIWDTLKQRIRYDGSVPLNCNQLGLFNSEDNSQLPIHYYDSANHKDIISQKFINEDYESHLNDPYLYIYNRKDIRINKDGNFTLPDGRTMKGSDIFGPGKYISVANYSENENYINGTIIKPVTRAAIKTPFVLQPNWFITVTYELRIYFDYKESTKQVTFNLFGEEKEYTAKKYLSYSVSNTDLTNSLSNHIRKFKSFNGFLYKKLIINHRNFYRHMMPLHYDTNIHVLLSSKPLLFYDLGNSHNDIATRYPLLKIPNIDDRFSGRYSYIPTSNNFRELYNSRTYKLHKWGKDDTHLTADVILDDTIFDKRHDFRNIDDPYRYFRVIELTVGPFEWYIEVTDSDGKGIPKSIHDELTITYQSRIGRYAGEIIDIERPPVRS